VTVALGGALVLLTHSLDAGATIGVGLDCSVERTPSSEWPFQGLDGGRVVLVLLLTCKHAAVLDARLLLEVLNRVALGREWRADFEVVFRRVEAALGRRRLLLPE